ncbi:hypothetical protein GGQ86_004088 [Xanthobacter flavus]|uniref:Uncharacterized protein n=1 Tax=Xanthobacter flavus TaxID=281 RepID=A0A9W6CLH6_XANFL|nr:hypothetical protein [Xanthobacter flavus]GLI24731.1 hypothetical protein XFLAVUS301_44050 [Xanthobacter flavus]
MGKANFTENFKGDAVVQITARRYPVAGCGGGGPAGDQQVLALRVEETVRQASDGPFVERLDRAADLGADFSNSLSIVIFRQ